MGFREKLNNLRLVRITKIFLKSIKIPTLEGLNLYTLIKIYLSGLMRGAITTRASAISWSLFLSLFPFLLFVYAWLPYLPNFDLIENSVYNFLVERIFPSSQADQIEQFLKENFVDNNYISVVAKAGISSWFTIVLTIIFATNGVNSLMTGFSNTTRRIAGVRERNVFQQYYIAFLFTLAVTIFLLFYLWFLIYMLNPGTEFLSSLIDWASLVRGIKRIIFFGTAFMFFLTAITFLYYYAVKFEGSIRKMLPGAILTSLLFFLLALGFGFYIENFNNYNLLYGSISTLLIVMLFLYATVIIILLGFELNMTLLYAKDRKDELIKTMQADDLLDSGEILEEEL